MNTICHISTVHPWNDTRILYRECGYLVKSGFDVYLVITADGDRVVNGVKIRALKAVGSRLGRMLFMPYRAMRKALATGANVFHYHDPELLPIGFLLRWVYNKKVIFDVHEDIPGHLKSKEYLPKVLRGGISCLYKLCERILLCGQEIVVANESCVGNYPERAVLVQNYPEMAGKSNTVKVGRPRLVYVGAVEEIRGVFIYLELAKRLKAAGKDVEMYIIGQYNTDLGEKIFSFISENNLGDRVHITGRVNWQEAMEIVAGASVGLCILKPEPNFISCLATKILEYMMAGVPVLCSDFAVWRKYVSDCQSGRMVDPLDDDEIFRVCCEMLEDPAGAEGFAVNGLRAVTDKYNWQVEYAKLLKCYENCICLG